MIDRYLRIADVGRKACVIRELLVKLHTEHSVKEHKIHQGLDGVSQTPRAGHLGLHSMSKYSVVEL